MSGTMVGFVTACSVQAAGSEPLSGLTLFPTADPNHVKYEYNPESGDAIWGFLGFPKKDGPFPVVIVNHSQLGDARQAGYNYAPPFLDRGYAIVTVNLSYSKKPEESDLPAMLRRLEECVTVIEHDERFDKKNIFMFGNGPAAMATLAFAAQTDKLRAVGLTGAGLLPKEGIQWEKVSAPVILVHGETDQTVPVDQGLQIKANLERAGKTVEMKVIKGSGHEVVTLKSAEVFGAIVEFFNKKKS